MVRMGQMYDITRILSQIDGGNPTAAEQLLPLVYDELRKLAAARLAQEKPGQTLQATALVHEAYLRLVGGGARDLEPVSDDECAAASPSSPTPSAAYNSRGHFFASAAEAMRRILVDRARANGSVKRGGSCQRLALTDVPLPDEALRVDDLLDLDAALSKLAAVDPMAARVVELRVFGGQSVEDAAAILGLSSSTAKRTWNYARAWLRREVGGDNELPKS
jgi:DNA-directed RNA polymerase specialized sigma24 family protein